MSSTPVFTDANVTVMVSDMNRAVQFYVEKVGLKLKSRYGDNFAELQAAGLTVALHPAVEDGPRPGNSESLSIGQGVENLEQAMSTLRGRGVTFGQVVSDGPVRLAFFKDPDGNPLYLSQMQKWS